MAVRVGHQQGLAIAEQHRRRVAEVGLPALHRGEELVLLHEVHLRDREITPRLLGAGDRQGEAEGEQ